MVTMRKYGIEFIVGLLMIAGVIAFVVLAFKVSGFTTFATRDTYQIIAEFTNVGDLKVRAPVTIAGVAIGQITKIKLDPKTYRAVVSMKIINGHKDIPIDSTANIFTAGLLGANYISITPGFEDIYLQDGGKIEKTNQALILQNLVGQLMYTLKNKDEKKK
jgi:phospholipid/cholesterol/gamma-HCH transport system substrate-binding protein